MENKKYVGHLLGKSETGSHFRALPYSGWGLILIVALNEVTVCLSMKMEVSLKSYEGIECLIIITFSGEVFVLHPLPFFLLLLSVLLPF